MTATLISEWHNTKTKVWAHLPTLTGSKKWQQTEVTAYIVEFKKEVVLCCVVRMEGDCYIVGLE